MKAIKENKRKNKVFDKYNRILMFISENEGKKRKDISENTNIPIKTLEFYLKALIRKKKIIYIGAPKNGGYFLNNDKKINLNKKHLEQLNEKEKLKNKNI